MIKIYGSPWSSARRVYWALEECGTSWERQPLNMQAKEHRIDAYLKINPCGKVPCIVDGNFVLWESMAITSYIAEKYNPSLLGSSAEEKALVSQWSYWAILDLQKPLVDILVQTMFVPDDKKDAAVLAKAKQELIPLLTILDRALEGRSYLTSKEFSIGDLNLASVVHINTMVKNDISQFKNIAGWMQKMLDRPAFKKVIELPR